MADVGIHLSLFAGVAGTYALKLYPRASGAIANGAGGDTLAEVADGYFSATVAESLTGLHRADVTFEGAVVYSGFVDMSHAAPVVDASVPQTGDVYALANGASGFVATKAAVDLRLPTSGYTAPDNAGIAVAAGAAAAAATDAAALVVTVGAAGDGLTSIPKTGYKLASDGLDSIATTAPAGVAANFREMVVQVWRRFFKKTTMSSDGAGSGEIKTFADNGTTVLTTQATTETSSLQTQGDAT